MIAVIDIGISNVSSVCRALLRLKSQYILTNKPDDLLRASHLIFPGVGTFAEASKRLKSSGLRDCIRELVLNEGKPILGICLGMQLLATQGEEGGLSEGLGLIKATVRKLRSTMRLPHIGWNDVTNHETKILSETPSNTCFYFVHSFEMIPEETIKIATSNYGIDFVAVAEKNNIVGTQFHPEKSQEKGISVLNKFISESW